MSAKKTKGQEKFEKGGGGLISVVTKEPPKTLTVSAQMHDHVMTVAKVPAKVFYYEPVPFVDAFQAVGAYYKLDGVLPFGDVYNFEAEALGQAMIYSDKAMPTIDFRDPLVKKPEDLANIKIPDWGKTKRVPYQWELTRLSVERGLANQGACCAPFSLAVGIRSYPLLIRDMRRDPKFAHELFTWIVDEVLTSYIRQMAKYANVSLILPADAWSCYPNLSSDMIDEWVVPYLQRLAGRLLADGIFVPAPCGDYCEERVEKFDKHTLWRCFESQSRAAGVPLAFLGMGRWQDFPLEAVAEYLDNKKAEGVMVPMTAGVNARLLREGPISAIVDNVKRFIDVLARRTHTDIFLANIPADTDPAHIHAAVAAVHTYGALPLADNLDDLKFELPQRESFDEFVKTWQK